MSRRMGTCPQSSIGWSIGTGRTWKPLAAPRFRTIGRWVRPLSLKVLFSVGIFLGERLSLILHDPDVSDGRSRRNLRLGTGSQLLELTFLSPTPEAAASWGGWIALAHALSLGAGVVSPAALLGTTRHPGRPSDVPLSRAASARQLSPQPGDHLVDHAGSGCLPAEVERAHPAPHGIVNWAYAGVSLVALGRRRTRLVEVALSTRCQSGHRAPCSHSGQRVHHRRPRRAAHRAARRAVCSSWRQRRPASRSKT